MGCDGTLGWDGVVGGREIQERTYVYLELIHVDVWQKPTQYCEAIILQSKQKKACMQMFIATLLLIVKSQKQPSSLSIGVKKTTVIHTTNRMLFSDFKKK